MNQQTLPIPNPQDWCTWAYAAHRLGVARQTVVNMVGDGRLTEYRNHGGAPMLWLPELEELAAARKRAGRA